MGLKSIRQMWDIPTRDVLTLQSDLFYFKDTVIAHFFPVFFPPLVLTVVKHLCLRVFGSGQKLTSPLSVCVSAGRLLGQARRTIGDAHTHNRHDCTIVCVCVCVRSGSQGDSLCSAK